MPAIVDCRSCGRKLRVTDELAGRKVQCPGCGEMFSADSALAPPPAESNGYHHTNGENGTHEPAPVEDRLPSLEESPPATRWCPKCNDYVAGEGPRCRYCGGDLDDDDEERPWEGPPHQQVRRDCEPERGGVILTMGIVSIFLPVLGIGLGLAACIMGAKDLGRMRKGQMDPQGAGTTMAGLICGIVGMIIWALLTLTCVAPMLLGFFFALTAARTVPPPARPVTMRVAPMPAPAPVPAPNPVRFQPAPQPRFAPAPQPPRVVPAPQPVRPGGGGFRRR